MCIHKPEELSEIEYLCDILNYQIIMNYQNLWKFTPILPFTIIGSAFFIPHKVYLLGKYYYNLNKYGLICDTCNKKYLAYIHTSNSNLKCFSCYLDSIH